MYQGTFGSVPWSFSVLLGDGSGAFTFLANYVGQHAFQPGAMADVNGDGIADFLAVNHSPSVLVIRPAIGDGTFGPAVATPAGPNAFAFGAPATGDVNGDGFTDVLASGGLCLNDGAGNVTLQDLLLIPGPGALVDADRDLQTDAVFLSTWSSSGVILVHRNVASCPGLGFRYGLGCPGAGGFVPSLAARGCASPGSWLAIDAADGLGGAAATLVVDSLSTFVPVGFGCTAFVPFLTPTFLSLPLSGPAVPGAGRASFLVLIPLGFPTGTIVGLQLAVPDPATPFQLSASNGVSLFIQ
jgi:hypothetical protein